MKESGKSPPERERGASAFDALRRVRRLEEERKLELLQEKRRDVRVLEEQVADLDRRRQSVVQRTSGDLLANRRFAETLFLVSERIRRELARSRDDLDGRASVFHTARARREALDELAERRARAAAGVRAKRSVSDARDELLLWRHRRSPPPRGGRS